MKEFFRVRGPQFKSLIFNADLPEEFSLFDYLENLERLSIRILESNVLLAIASNLKNLRSLDIAGSRVSCVDLRRAFVNKQLGKLRELNLFGFTHLDDPAIETIAYNCRGLRRLNLRECITISDEGFKNILKNCRMITHLSILETEITEEGLVGIESLLPNLRHLQLDDSSFSDEFISELIRKLPRAVVTHSDHWRYGPISLLN